MAVANDNNDVPLCSQKDLDTESGGKPEIVIPKQTGRFTPPAWTWWPIRRRYLVSVLGFLGFIHVYLLRVNMSFAIVAMTKNHSVIDDNGTITYVTIF